LILGHHYEHIGLVVSLQQHGLLDNGEYFVVGVDLEQYDLSSPEKYLRGVLQNDPDADSVTGFQSYLGIIPSAPVKFEEFAIEVNKYLEMAPFGYVNPLNHIGGVKQIRAEAAYLYDAVHLYANSLIRVIDEGGDPRNGIQIVNALKGSNYQSAMGYIVHVDDNGDAAGNYTILARKFLNDTVGFGLVPVGIFSVPKGVQLPKMHLNENIEFIGGDCPVAEPECGFRGEKCISK
jgi:guanylate cyclase, other